MIRLSFKSRKQPSNLRTRHHRGAFEHEMRERDQRLNTIPSSTRDMLLYSNAQNLSSSLWTLPLIEIDLYLRCIKLTPTHPNRTFNRFVMFCIVLDIFFSILARNNETSSTLNHLNHLARLMESCTMVSIPYWIFQRLFVRDRPTCLPSFIFRMMLPGLTGILIKRALPVYDTLKQQHMHSGLCSITAYEKGPISLPRGQNT